MMVARLDAERIEASRGLEHRVDYCCPNCGAAVVLHARVGGWVIPHFKHKRKDLCAYGIGETPAHRAIKALLRDHYRSRSHCVELEYRLENRRADVFLADERIAFEVEFSSKEVGGVASKCRDYARLGVRSLWILKQDIPLSKIIIGERVLISASPVLHFLLSKQKLRGVNFAFFSYEQGNALVFRGLLSSLMLYREYHEFSGGGGYEYPSKSRMWLKIRGVIGLQPSIV